ncbi:MAG: AAA-like domain-containing protein [Chloroflexota bacterium]
MEREFNTAGPIIAEDHYHIPPLSRFDLDEIERLIYRKKYFILHAPRQVGKTSYLLALTDYLNKQGKVRCLYMNVEIAQAARENVNNAIPAIVGEMSQRAIRYLQDTFIQDNWGTIVNQFGAFSALNMLLTKWTQNSELPLVLFIDEIDSLVGDTLISVLRQLRAGYDKRPTEFPQSIILCGVRDIRDYRIHSDLEKTIITGGSAFNIKAESLRLDNFTREEVHLLYQQHTDETSQVFTDAALAQVWHLTNGQPWLVNALGNEVTYRMKEARDRSLTITEEMVILAKERIIRRRETHLDQLADKLREDRVRRVINPMLQGIDLGDAALEDDLQYLVDLGLITRNRAEGPQIANPIYREIIPRQLTTITEANFESMIRTAPYIQADGRLDMEKVMTDFQQFYRENAEIWVERFLYKEAGPHLLMQAYLQRIVNGGGMISREYGLGRGRTDLLIYWPVNDVDRQRVVLELKVFRGKKPKTLDKHIQKGLEQTWQYMDRCGTDKGHLVIFDRTPDKSWGKKVFRRVETYQGHDITVWGM